jgi:CRISPR-associated endonuclease/helicase Cas3
MNRATTSQQIALRALDGANPLGFLAALGTLVTAHTSGYVRARLAWRYEGKWLPILTGLESTPGREPDEQALSQALATGLAGRTIPEALETARAEGQRQFESAKKNAKKKRDEIKKRKLRGKERAAAIELEVAPLERERDERRDAWLEALARAVPRAELALGKRLDCTAEEYREHVSAFRKRAGPAQRETLDLLAAFGSDACLAERSESVEATPFQFITGSGHQFFLETVEKLMGEVTPDRVREALFESWQYRDEGLSMRWDPIEDRRYALMDRDPTASGNKARTVWMANLLAYRALVLLPSAPRHRLRTTGWLAGDEPTFSWPLWSFPAPPDTIRSLLGLRELAAKHPKAVLLAARGVAVALRARRIKVGGGANFKLNFTPSRVVAATSQTKST